ncbi:nitrate reductase molybdenum cofactor assembly chaperone [Corynebacterium atypicum]|uniref:nitrate reductase molybdenum cofactor assembly chaperone n=1 Tax=Corynebacterium atypicum TaxID=191610 RepID=UPI000690D33B|nr:nitrate reductase molybdenum cofactor assembly chaperone [Corynebacterium atypicum]
MRPRKRTFFGAPATRGVDNAPVSAAEQRAVFMAASVLLDYPGEDFLDRLKIVGDEARRMESAAGAELTEFVRVAQARGRRDMEIDYVETFDQRRRCSLYLTYYAVGDTRQRGAALLAFRQQLRALGFEQDREELPDHLCVILEAAALAEPARFGNAVEILSAYRDALEVLHTALAHQDSPWVHIIRAVCLALPPLDQETTDRYLELIRSGPPAEMVGLGSPPAFSHARGRPISRNRNEE